MMSRIGFASGPSSPEMRRRNPFFDAGRPLALPSDIVA
jgi:hypothetical protein